MLLQVSADQLRLEIGLLGTFKDVPLYQFKKTLTSTLLTDLLFSQDTTILFYMIHYPNYTHNFRGYIFNAMLPFIQSHRQRITFSRGLQRILVNNHVDRYHISRRKGNHVTSMIKHIIQTKSHLVFVAKTTFTQTFRLESVETNFDADATQNNEQNLKIPAWQVRQKIPLPLEIILLDHYKSVICQTWTSLQKLCHDQSRFKTQ